MEEAMSDLHKQIINVSVTIHAPVHVVWESWTEPEHVTKWNQASDDWHTPSGTNDLVPGGRFNYRMEAKDGSMGFDFEGTYDLIEREKRIEYTMDDDRQLRSSLSRREIRHTYLRRLMQTPRTP
jgi:uncharacterized protein YndB with AHSA1/START domain